MQNKKDPSEMSLEECRAELQRIRFRENLLLDESIALKEKFLKDLNFARQANFEKESDKLPEQQVAELEAYFSELEANILKNINIVIDYLSEVFGWVDSSEVNE